MRPEPESRLRSSVGPAGRWTLQEARADDDEEMLRLFSRVFGQDMTLAQWRWKYQHAILRGVLLRKGDEPVAFFGGMPRAVWSPEGVLAAVQNGDVMVSAAERGVFTRQGALYQVAAAYFDRMVGEGRDYALAYGFPNERHFRLGAKLGLYRGGGRMLSLTWSCVQAQEQSIWHSDKPLSPQDIELLGPLWDAMRRDWPERSLPVRDAARWTWRYLSHPTNRYQLRVVRRRWSGRALCALALREHPGHVEWLDYVGPRANLPLAIRSARRFAFGCGGKPLVSLVSEAIATDFSADAATREPAMPVALSRASHAACDAAPLWLMGGDTDFL